MPSLAYSARAFSSCSARTFHCDGFSLWGTGSRHASFRGCGSWALELKLGSHGRRAWLLRGMWALRSQIRIPTNVLCIARQILNY